MNRDEHFVEMAKLVASRSKDASQVGAVIVDPKGRVISTGYNGFPRQMPDVPSLYADRPEKLSRIIHAEMNALIFAHRDVEGCTLYTWPLLSCDRCIVHMIQAGMTRYVASKCPDGWIERWERSLERTRSYIVECGCTFLEL